MKSSFELHRYHLKVFSAICSNLTAAWFIGVFLARDPFVLTATVLAVIVSLYLALKTEQLLDEYEF